MTDINIAPHKRYDAQLKVADIPATMADATEQLADVGGLFRTVDQTITLATARALIDATAKDAIPETVIGQLAIALRGAQLPSGPAKLATRALGAALRVAKDAKGPMTGGDALAEAREITAVIFDHDTKRRNAARAEAKQRKLDEAAKKAAEKAAAGVEGAGDGEPAEPACKFGLTVAGKTREISEAEAIALEAYLKEMREAAEKSAEALRKAERDAKKAEHSLQAA